ncbi:hypothetical protein AB1Y20_019996 [Prymnesium parvum]|uniref:Retinoblastoma-associated protein A-box domain-containing protein n=1 Tax=Prymnesium parvum TaxID=97485 RepID=A0AB34JTV3_PRYPA
MGSQRELALSSWKDLCEDMKYPPSMHQKGSELIEKSIATKDHLVSEPAGQGHLNCQLSAIAYLSSSKQADISTLLVRFSIPIRTFLNVIDDIIARVQPGVPLPELHAFKAAFVVDSFIFQKWKILFHDLFPDGFVGESKGSVEYDLSFEMSWSLFSLAKAKLLGSKGEWMESFLVLALVAHFLLGHLPDKARTSGFWAELEFPCPQECYPLPQEAQNALWTRMRAQPNDALVQQFMAVIEDLKTLFGVVESTVPQSSHGGCGGQGIRGFFSLATMHEIVQTLKAMYSGVWPSRMPFDAHIFLQLPAAPHITPSTPGSPGRYSQTEACNQLLTPLRQTAPTVTCDKHLATPFTSQLDSVEWLLDAAKVDCLPYLQKFYNACPDSSKLAENIKKRLENLCGKVKTYLQTAEVPCDVEERCMLGMRLYYKILLEFLKSEEDRLKQTNFSALLSNDSFHTSLFACCMEGVFASYTMRDVAFPTITKILGLHAFDFMKVIESFVKHEPNLPSHLKHHYQRVESRVIESFAWSHDSPLHALMREYEASSNAIHEGGQTRAKAALQQFMKKCRYLAGKRTQELCVLLLLPSALVQQVWSCVKIVLNMCRSLLENRHLDQIIMCSVYGVCRVNNKALPKQVTFREIIEKYKQQPHASAMVFREVFMTAEEEPQDIIKFYNKIFIPVMKEHLLLARQGNPNGMDSPGLEYVVGASPQRVTTGADVYVSQPRNIPMSPRTKKLYAFPTTPVQTASEGLRKINRTLNPNAAVADSAAQTLQALSSSTASAPQSVGDHLMAAPQPPAEQLRKRSLNLSQEQAQDGPGSGSRRVMQRRWEESMAAERSASASSAGGESEA